MCIWTGKEVAGAGLQTQPGFMHNLFAWVYAKNAGAGRKSCKNDCGRQIPGGSLPGTGLSAVGAEVAGRGEMKKNISKKEVKKRQNGPENRFSKIEQKWVVEF